MPADTDFLPITRPVLGDRELELMAKPLGTGWLVQGPFVKQFEKAFCEFTGAGHAIAVANCTAGLHLILAALGIGPGDEVIVPSFTYIATANAVEYTGARPVFCDIDLATFNMDPSRLPDLITKRTRAIMPVSLFGLCADMESINKIAEAHNLAVVEDAACGLGARRSGNHAGVEARAAAFSFHPRKSITTGEGGMLVTNDDELADRMGKLRNHGAEATDLERHREHGGSLLPAFHMLGFNYRMTDIQGALGVAQMERLRGILDERLQAAARYDEMLAGCPIVRPPRVPPDCRHAYQSYVVLYTRGLDPDMDNLPELNRKRNQMMFEMEKAGIQVRQGTHAVHTLDYYAGKYQLAPRDYPHSLTADRLSISLPLFVGITGEQQRRVMSFITDYN